MNDFVKESISSKALKILKNGMLNLSHTSNNKGLYLIVISYFLTFDFVKEFLNIYNYFSEPYFTFIVILVGVLGAVIIHRVVGIVSIILMTLFLMVVNILL
jgi:hypothetical protein